MGAVAEAAYEKCIWRAWAGAGQEMECMGGRGGDQGECSVCLCWSSEILFTIITTNNLNNLTRLANLAPTMASSAAIMTSHVTPHSVVRAKAVCSVQFVKLPSIESKDRQLNVAGLHCLYKH